MWMAAPRLSKCIYGGVLGVKLEFWTLFLMGRWAGRLAKRLRNEAGIRLAQGGGPCGWRRLGCQNASTGEFLVSS